MSHSKDNTSLTIFFIIYAIVFITIFVIGFSTTPTPTLRSISTRIDSLHNLLTDIHNTCKKEKSSFQSDTGYVEKD